MGWREELTASAARRFCFRSGEILAGYGIRAEDENANLLTK